MNKRGVGILFCLISTILYSTHYLATAIYLSNSQTWSADLFSNGLSYTGNFLDIFSLISLGLGVFYLVWAEKKNDN